MSATAHSGAMWAHYAASHTGVALELEFSDAQMTTLFPVAYDNDRRVILQATDDLSEQEVRKRIIEQIVRTKASCWRYEAEYRWVFNIPGSAEVLVDEHGFIYRGFPQELRRIVLGVECELNAGAIRKALDDMTFADVEATRALMSDTKFDIVIEPL